MCVSYVYIYVGYDLNVKLYHAFMKEPACSVPSEGVRPRP